MNPTADTQAIGWHLFLQALGAVYAVLVIGKALFKVFA